MEFSGPEYWSGYPFPSPGDLTNSEIEPRSPALQVDSLQAEPPGKPKNIGVGSLSLLQRIFPTQESNWGSPALQADSLPTELSGQPGEPANQSFWKRSGAECVLVGIGQGCLISGVPGTPFKGYQGTQTNF